jgi:hypothetical protein
MVNIPRIVKSLPDPQCGFGDTVKGADFDVPYGPVYTPDNSNLLYIASYTKGKTIFYSLVIRGTQAGTSALALYQQLFQDLNAPNRVDWSNIAGKQDLSKVACNTTGVDGTQAAIAKGTCNGMGKLMSLTFPVQTGTSIINKTPLKFLQDVLKDDPKIPVIVTGHSLGGTQVCLWMFD